MCVCVYVCGVCMLTFPAPEGPITAVRVDAGKAELTELKIFLPPSFLLRVREMFLKLMVMPSAAPLSSAAGAAIASASSPRPDATFKLSRLTTALSQPSALCFTFREVIFSLSW